MHRRAFTLVELLVVIAIIGLLSTVAVVSLSSVRIKSRNAERTADIRQLNNVFGMIFASSGSYPASAATANTWACLSKDCRGLWASIPAYAPLDATMSEYIAIKPDDPSDPTRGIAGYIYNSSWVGGTGPSGNTFSPGPTLQVLFENPMSSCPLGILWDNHSNYYQCLITLY